MKIIVPVILLIVTFIILNEMYKKTNHHKNALIQLQKYINGVPENLEIVNTGSSYARYAFDYSETDLKGFNFGLQPQSLSYDFRILKQYTPNLQEDCIVLITLPNLVFGFLDYKNNHSNTKYYYFLEPKNILGYSKLKHLIRVSFPIVSAKTNFLRIIKDVPSASPYTQKSNLMTKHQVQEEASARVLGWQKQFNLKNTKDESSLDVLEGIFESTTNLLNEMIEYCLVHNFKPVIIVPPTSGILNELMSKEFMKKALYDNIEKANRAGVPVLDYLYDVRFQDYEMYINADMLNETGRDKFTKTVIADLEELGYMKENADEKI